MASPGDNSSSGGKGQGEGSRSPREGGGEGGETRKRPAPISAIESVVKHDEPGPVAGEAAAEDQRRIRQKQENLQETEDTIMKESSEDGAADNEGERNSGDEDDQVAVTSRAAGAGAREGSSPSAPSEGGESSNSDSTRDICVGDNQWVSSSTLVQGVMQQYLSLAAGAGAAAAEPAGPGVPAVAAGRGANVTESSEGNGSGSGSGTGGSSKRKHGKEGSSTAESVSASATTARAGTAQGGTAQAGTSSSSSGGSNRHHAMAASLANRHPKNKYNPKADLKPPPGESKEERRRRMNRITGRRKRAKVVIEIDGLIEQCHEYTAFNQKLKDENAQIQKSAVKLKEWLSRQKQGPLGVPVGVLYQHAYAESELLANLQRLQQAIDHSMDPLAHPLPQPLQSVLRTPPPVQPPAPPTQNLVSSLQQFQEAMAQAAAHQQPTVAQVHQAPQAGIPMGFQEALQLLSAASNQQQAPHPAPAAVPPVNPFAALLTGNLGGVINSMSSGNTGTGMQVPQNPTFLQQITAQLVAQQQQQQQIHQQQQSVYQNQPQQQQQQQPLNSLASFLQLLQQQQQAQGNSQPPYYPPNQGQP